MLTFISIITAGVSDEGRGTGKSWLARQLAEKVYPNALLFDESRPYQAQKHHFGPIAEMNIDHVRDLLRGYQGTVITVGDANMASMGRLLRGARRVQRIRMDVSLHPAGTVERWLG